MAFIRQKPEITKVELDCLLSLPGKSFRDYKKSYRLINVAIIFAMLMGAEKRNLR